MQATITFILPEKTNITLNLTMTVQDARNLIEELKNINEGSSDFRWPVSDLMRILEKSVRNIFTTVDGELKA